MHISRTALFRWRLLLCFVLLLAAVQGRPALAQSSSWAIYQTFPSFSSGLTYVLWVKSGVTDASGNYTGDQASIWTVDATGHQTAISPTYGPYPGWHAAELVSAFDGTLRMAWTQNSGATADTSQDILSFWTLDGAGNQTSISPTYGPYPGWRFYEAYANPDGTTALYWTKNSYDSSGAVSANQLSIWAVDTAGNQLSISPTYGPYPGWLFVDGVPSLNKDGTSFLTWINFGATDSSSNYTGDQVSIWKTDSRGNETSTGPIYGPYPGWHLNELYPAYDGTARLLWTLFGTYDSSNNYSGDTASVWSVNAAGSQTAMSPTYGPYPGWITDSLLASPSGTSRLLWILPGTYDSSNNYSGDTASIWSLSAADVETSLSPLYTSPGGTVSGGLTVMPDGSERLTWQGGSDFGIFSQWSLDASNNCTATGPEYDYTP